MNSSPPRLTLLVFGLASTLCASEATERPRPGQVPDPKPRVIRESVTLDVPRLETSLLIAADGIVVDGGGAEIVGPGEPGRLESFRGVGIRAEGRRGVTLRNFKVRGFRTGLRLIDCSGWTIEDCDYSGNYHDPDYGWGDGRRVGGMILDRVTNTLLRRCRARRVWNGLDLLRCDDNVVEDCDFSRCSNVCLRLETSRRNRIHDSNLSYGLRIRPGEVHARDSTCVLLESGSNGNRIERCDITHGGDGIFVRVLNGWCSTGNVFVENDCSYANNNAVESWSPGNTWIRNKANHSSYGFWLGGSDHTVLIGNEAAYNGQPDGFHNAPESDFGHGGIVIVHGTGTHTLIEGNDCHHNAGGGIVFRGDLTTRGGKWPMYHLVIQKNRLAHNRWGIFGRFTDWVHLSSNRFEGNDEDTHFEEVTNVVRHAAAPLDAQRPEVRILGPTRARVGETTVFRASGSPGAQGGELSFLWDVGQPDWSVGVDRHEGPRLERTFDRPGLYRVGLTAHDGHLAALAWVDLIVSAAAKELGTEGATDAERWLSMRVHGSGAAPGAHLAADADVGPVVGSSALRLRADPYDGRGVALRIEAPDDSPWNLIETTRLSFWLRFRNENLRGFRGPNPIVRLYSGEAVASYAPSFRGRPRNLLSDAPWPEAREGWLRVEVPLSGGASFRRVETYSGEAPPHYSEGLRFQSRMLEVAGGRVETQSFSALTSGGGWLWLATRDGERLLRSQGGGSWEEMPSPRVLGGHADWRTAALAWSRTPGEEGSLLLRRRHSEKNDRGERPARLAIYDIATESWSWLKTGISANQAHVVVDDTLYGISCSRLGNFGGAVTRVDLDHPLKIEERTMLRLSGTDPHWLGPPSTFVARGELIYGIKNDWSTPQPREAPGDRLFRWRPAEFRASLHRSGWFDDPGGWEAAETPSEDLGALPFEIGGGAALVILPPRWGSRLGSRGGAFVLAGCSPSNQDGFGPPSAQFGLYDFESRVWCVGKLPGETGTGTSAALHDGKIFIKRGGMSFGAPNSELWTVEGLGADEYTRGLASAETRRFDPGVVDALTIQFDSDGRRPFTVWVDGLRFE